MLKICLLIFSFIVFLTWAQSVESYSDSKVKEAIRVKFGDKVDATEKEVTRGCPCPRMDNFDPVCGTDHRTYANPCLLRCRQRVDKNLRQACRGRCPCKKGGEKSLF